MVEKIEGKIEAVTKEKGKAVKISGRWFNSTDKTQKFVEQLAYGDEVVCEYEIGQDNRNYINFISKKEQEQKTVESETIKDNDTLNSPELLALMKIAAEEHKVEMKKGEPRTYKEILDGLISIFHAKVTR